MSQLGFYATVSRGEPRPWMPAVPVLLVASSWFAPASPRRPARLLVPRLPAQVTERAADGGGFVATRIWGDYRYSADQYVDWLRAWGPAWAATLDYCCEDELTGGRPGLVRERQARTTDQAARFLARWPDAPWAWVPTVQGWHPEDYARHAEELRPLVEAHRARAARLGLGRSFRVGVGTLCRREKGGQIADVVAAVSATLPGVPLHLWGVKLTLFKRAEGLPEDVVSVDSAAWNGQFHDGRREWKTSGLTQLRWAYQVALPRYRAKLERALAPSKQLRLPLVLPRSGPDPPAAPITLPEAAG